MMTEPDTPPRTHTRMVLAIVATAMFMTQLDSTVIATVIPVMAREFGTNPVHLKLALTSYLLAIAIFIPASGWAADRFGARRVFSLAMIVFTLGSVACALSESLWALVGARIIQGMGGAMLVPVGRIVVLRTLPRTELVSALALLAIPQLIAPILGPPVGGFIATYSSWQWIFWINVPIAFVCVALAGRYMPELKSTGASTFDWTGFALIGPGLAAVLAGISLVGVGLLSAWQIALVVIIGVVLMFQFARHVRAKANPLIDLNLLTIPTFANGILAAFLFRASIGCSLFLVPLVLQEGLGKTAFEAGAITLVLGVGAIMMKFIGPPVLKRFGFRRVMIPNGIACAIFAALPMVFLLQPPVAVMMLILFSTSLARSLQFVATNAVIYADIPDHRIASATSFFAVAQELSGAAGIAVAAAVMQTYQLAKGTTLLAADDFVVIFITVGLISASQLIPLARLASDAGNSLHGSSKTKPAQ